MDTIPVSLRVLTPAFRQGAPSIPLRDAIDPIAYAYSRLLEHTGDLMDLAMHEATEEQAAILVHLAQGMAERCLVVRQLAERRLLALKDAHA